MSPSQLYRYTKHYVTTSYVFIKLREIASRTLRKTNRLQHSNIEYISANGKKENHSSAPKLFQNMENKMRYPFYWFHICIEVEQEQWICVHKINVIFRGRPDQHYTILCKFHEKNKIYMVLLCIWVWYWADYESHNTPFIRLYFAAQKHISLFFWFCIRKIVPGVFCAKCKLRRYSHIFIAFCFCFRFVVPLCVYRVYCICVCVCVFLFCFVISIILGSILFSDRI